MSQVCSKCSHPNPPEAIYCYFDGVVLAGRAASGRALQAGSQPFASQFVFPSGVSCRNFDQLATACQQNWAAAVDLLRKGHLASFLAGIGRSDLAMAAKEAARFPDVERGLDRFLAKLPTQVLDPPKLRVEPTEVSLGLVEFGTNRGFELHLANLGLRLLYGTVTSDCKWLTLGDAPGNPQKLFQFGGDVVVHVQIRGKFLRAGTKPLEGHLLVESNGGTVPVKVRVEVPPKAYPNSVLAGATTPRQIAEKALAAPKEAAGLFETGAVAKWFASNGWTYPVQGPAASGVGAVQQFFEALGLARAPKVEINPTSLTLRGEVGQAVQATLELKTQEKRPVYGHAVCDQPWLEVSRSVLTGRNAVIKVLVPRVPNRPGESLEAVATVTANGNQKFKVPVYLEIGGVASQTIPLVPLEEPVLVAEAIPIPLSGSQLRKPGNARPVIVAAPVPVAGAAAAVTVSPRSSGRGASAVAEKAVPAAALAEPGPIQEKWVDEPDTASRVIGIAMHLLPAALLALLLLGIVLRDVLFAPAPAADDIPIDPSPRIAVYCNETGKKDQLESVNGTMTFGLAELPRKVSDREKKLTYDFLGRTNSTVIRVGGADTVFGFPGQGKWLTKADKLDKLGSMKSVWLVKDPQQAQLKIQVTQLVEIVAGEPIEDSNGQLRRYLDTCSIRYVLENTGKVNAEVGLRMVLDTLIGSNDGVPFTVPGRKGLVRDMAEFKSKKDMPDFIQVLELADLARPGVVAFVNLKLGGNVEQPGRVQLTRWPFRTESINIWNVPMAPFEDDSAVVLYWNPRNLKPAEKREVGFSYGLGSVATTGGQLGISVGGSFVPNGDLTLLALVNEPAPGQTLTLRLPPHIELIEGEAMEKVPPVPAGATVQQSPVTWRLRADRQGTYEIEVISSTGAKQKKKITIKAKTIF